MRKIPKLYEIEMDHELHQANLIELTIEDTVDVLTEAFETKTTPLALPDDTRILILNDRKFVFRTDNDYEALLVSMRIVIEQKGREQ